MNNVLILNIIQQTIFQITPSHPSQTAFNYIELVHLHWRGWRILYKYQIDIDQTRIKWIISWKTFTRITLYNESEYSSSGRTRKSKCAVLIWRRVVRCESQGWWANTKVKLLTNCTLSGWKTARSVWSWYKYLWKTKLVAGVATWIFWIWV